MFGDIEVSSPEVAVARYPSVGHCATYRSQCRSIVQVVSRVNFVRPSLTRSAKIGSFATDRTLVLMDKNHSSGTDELPPCIANLLMLQQATLPGGRLLVAGGCHSNLCTSAMFRFISDSGSRLHIDCKPGAAANVFAHLS